MQPNDFWFAGCNNDKKGRWNVVPMTPGRPRDFFTTTAGHAYLSTMDYAMHTARQETAGRATVCAFKQRYYQGERNYRAWLVQHPPQIALGFVRDFGDYDARYGAMLRRYEAGRGTQGYTPVGFRTDDRVDGQQS